VVKPEPPQLPTTPRGSDVFVPARRGATSLDMTDTIRSWLYNAPIGFIFIVIMSFLSRYWRVRSSGFGPLKFEPLACFGGIALFAVFYSLQLHFQPF
jgi:hypothetical protein